MSLRPPGFSRGEVQWVELLDGEIVKRAPIGSRHAETVKRLVVNSWP